MIEGVIISTMNDSIAPYLSLGHNKNIIWAFILDWYASLTLKENISVGLKNKSVPTKLDKYLLIFSIENLSSLSDIIIILLNINCISLFSSQDLESKENELDEYLKIIIKLKNELKELKNENNGDIEDYKLEDSLNKCQSEISGKYMNLKSMILKLKQTENSEITVDYINNTVADIINITSAMKSVIFSLYKQITDKNREIQSLREDITSNNSNLTKQELLEIIDEKEKIISAYADKIQGLEHELKNQK